MKFLLLTLAKVEIKGLSVQGFVLCLLIDLASSRFAFYVTRDPQIHQCFLAWHVKQKEVAFPLLNLKLPVL